MPITEAVDRILGFYQYENAGVRTNLFRLLNHGALGGTGRLVILPVDQGFEHGPYRSFAPNPAGLDPNYHFKLALEAGCSAYAAPLGFLQAGAHQFAGQIPLILKVNNSDSLAKIEPCSSLTSSVKDAIEMGCIGIGFTIYPGSAQRNTMYEQLKQLVQEARAHGLIVVVWSYPRGSGLDKEGELALDVVSYGAHIAAQLGAHVIKVKLPKAHIFQNEAKKVYEKYPVDMQELVNRVRHVVDCCFNGRRLVVFSGGEAKNEAELLAEALAIHNGGGNGSIVGRNAFQRSSQDAIKLLKEMMEIYLSEAPPFNAGLK